MKAIGVSKLQTAEFTVEFHACQQAVPSVTIPQSVPPFTPTSSTAGEYMSDNDPSPRSPSSMTPEELEQALNALGSELG